MSALTSLGLHDLRPRLSVKPNPPGYMISRRDRRGPVIGATVHYNGPRLGVAGNPTAEINFVVNTDVPNHQQRIGADSLQYHFVIPSDGSIWQTRDLNLIAWHCRHNLGNEQHLAIHLPIGEGQKPTPAQVVALDRLLDALQADYGFKRTAVKGHQEWASTACPGVYLMDYVRGRRNTAQPVPAGLTVLSAPRISADVFGTVLRGANSTAAAVSADLYGICIEEGIDPAVALAFFARESTYGTAGICKEYNTHNWGNVRTPEDKSLGRTVETRAGQFATYSTWQAGLRDWCRRIKGPKYVGAGLVTVEAILVKYAPSSDGNAPAAYAQAVRELVSKWAAMPQPKATQVWVCAANVKLRQAPKTHDYFGRNIPVVRTYVPGERLVVDEVKVGGDAEVVEGDGRWLHAADGSGFTWAKAWRRES